MGCKWSTGICNGSSTVNDGVKEYEKACWRDRDVQNFDANLRQRTTELFNFLATVSGPGGGTAEMAHLSLEYLGQVNGFLTDTNKDVVDVLLKYKNDVRKDTELLEIVQEYFNYSDKTLDFFTALDDCLKRARDHELIIQSTLRQFEEEIENDLAFSSASEKFSKTLQELKRFREAGDPFSAEFFNVFDLVYKQQQQLLGKLKVRILELDKKLGSIKVYRKVSTIIFVAALVAVVICSVAAVAATAPPVVSALVAAATSAPAGELGRWISSLWKKYEEVFKAPRDLYGTVHVATYVTIEDLDAIRRLVRKLQNEIEALLNHADIALRDAKVVTVVIVEIGRKITGFTGAINMLTKHSDASSRYIREARAKILRDIPTYPRTGLNVSR